jgi:pyruvate dehydrogenase E2 component (dihydrolipoamide acetyltransferase)
VAEELQVPYQILDGSGPNNRVVEVDVRRYIEERDTRAITPAAKSLAWNRNVDLRFVRGSGPNGRVEVRDVQAARPSYPYGGLERIDMTGMRRTIADRMSYSATIPQFQLTGWVEMKAAMAMRAKAKAAGRAWTISDLLMAAVARGIADVPQMGDLFAGDHIVRRHRLHLGLAIALEPPGSGLIVPVLRDVDRKDLDTLAAERREITGRARVGKLKPDEYKGGIFTVSNLGTFDIDSFTAVVQPGEAGILAIGKVAPRVVAEGDAICVRQTMSMTLSADHRVVDGADGARFLQAVKAALEAPEQLDIS